MTTEHPMQQWLSDHDYVPPKRGQVREGVIVRQSDHGLFIDVGLKQEGFVPRSDLEALDKNLQGDLEIGASIKAKVITLEDREGNLVLSISQIQAERDWDKAEALLKSNTLWKGQISGYNQGGLLVQFGQLRAFIPNSQITDSENHNGSQDEREAWMKDHVGQTLALKIITADRKLRRLIMSERQGRQELRHNRTKELLNELKVGQVISGQVRQLSNFGAFVDLYGGDGMIHVSELAWHKIRHPSEVVEVGQPLEVYILDLDQQKERISLSLKQLQPDPWELIQQTYQEGQLIAGQVSNVVDFGAFVILEDGLEGLVHISEMSEPPPNSPQELVAKGDTLQLRIIHIDTQRHRISLSMKEPPQIESPAVEEPEAALV